MTGNPKAARRDPSWAGARPAAVAGTWYPGTEAALREAVVSCLATTTPPPGGDIVGLLAPHAGLMAGS